MKLVGKNVKALETILSESTKAAYSEHAFASQRQSKTPLRACVPLYHGSRVCSGCSGMHGFESTNEPLIHQGEDAITTKTTKHTSTSSPRRLRSLRTASIPKDRRQIKKLLRSHSQQIVDYLFEARRAHDAKAWANRRRGKTRKQRRVSLPKSRV